MSVVGIEPTTNGLKGHCSAIELHAHMRVGFYHALLMQVNGGEWILDKERRKTGWGISSARWPATCAPLDDLIYWADMIGSHQTHEY